MCRRRSRLGSRFCTAGYIAGGRRRTCPEKATTHCRGARWSRCPSEYGLQISYRGKPRKRFAERCDIRAQEFLRCRKSAAATFRGSDVEVENRGEGAWTRREQE